MHTGDILLFKGNGLFSALIMAAPGANYSHVGIFVNHPTYGPSVFESTSLGTLPDKITSEKICGVQLVDYKERIKTYDGDVFCQPIIGERTPEQLSKVWAFIDEWHGTPYEEDNLQLARAELDIFPWQKNKPDASSLFCSETVVMCLRYAKIFEDDGTPANEFTPTDCSNEAVTLISGYTFGELVYLQSPS